MTAARHGAATLRAVLGSLFVVLVISFGAAVVGRNYFNEQDRHAPFQPPPTRQIQSIAPRVVDAPLERSDPLHALWCERGSNAVIEATADVMSAQFDAGQSEQSMQRALLRAEAQLTQGQVQAALEGSNRMQESLKKHPSLLAMEPAVLEQSARIHIEAGEVNVQKLEAPLRATIEARVLLGTAVPVEAWATLGTLHKARGDCQGAIENYDAALRGLDAPAWAALQRQMPWRLQILALVAMDRADCFSTMGANDKATASAIRLAAELASALGENDPLSKQAGDLRDQIVNAVP